MIREGILDGLVSDLAKKAIQFDHLMKEEHGTEVLIYCGRRTCAEQARLFRKSRTRAEIEAKMEDLRARGFGFLAAILDGVGPQWGELGKHVTNAGPGESLHQYGMAWDGVPMVDGKPEWSGLDPVWTAYVDTAEILNLHSGARWPRFKELPHVQSRPGFSPLRVYPPEMARKKLANAGAL